MTTGIFRLKARREESMLPSEFGSKYSEMRAGIARLLPEIAHVGAAARRSVAAGVAPPEMACKRGSELQPSPEPAAETPPEANAPR